LRHAVGIFEHQSLQFREVEIGAVAVQVRNLLGRDPAFSADGRADIDSKWASDKGCDAKFCQAFELGIDQLRAHLSLFHLQVSPEKFGMMGRDLDGHDDATEPAARQVVHQPHKEPTDWATLIGGCSGNSCHKKFLSSRDQGLGARGWQLDFAAHCQLQGTLTSGP